jgi:hypothetical protein
MSTKKSQGPLLYIHQPFTTTPSNSMQDVFTNKFEMKQQQEELLGKENRKKMSSPKKEDSYEPVEIEITTAENQQEVHEEKKHSSFKRVKSFKEMGIKERLDYLFNFPKVLPPVPCVFYTKEKNLQGYLSDYQDELVTIKFHDQTTKTIAVQDLKNIIMIGIKK